MTSAFIALVDIDHTLSDAAWRDDMIASGDWDAYHTAGKDDKSIIEMAVLIQSLYRDEWKIICITARPEKWRTHTINWMIKHNIQVDEILMRPDNAFRPASDMKVELLKQRFGENLEELAGSYVVFFDDNDNVIEAIRGLGITTLQCSAAKRKDQ